MSKIINGITDDRLNELFRHGHLGHPHEVAVMAGELIEHRRCKDCDGVHDGSCVNTSEAKAPVMKWWKHRHYHDITCKTENGIITETNGGQGMIESEIRLNLWREITEAEYLAATKPAAPVVDSTHGLPSLPTRCAPVVDPWAKPYSIDSGAIRQLQRRLEAVEKAGKI